MPSLLNMQSSSNWQNSRGLDVEVVWQLPSKEEEQHTFRTIPREHWLIRSVHGTPKLTIKKLRPARFAPLAQFITTGLYSLMVLLIQR